MRSSYLPSSMADGTLNGGSRDADVELRSRADRGSHSLARGCSPQRSAHEQIVAESLTHERGFS
jgi:hypothetical protein